MDEPFGPHPEMTMDTIMRRWPFTISVVIRHNMLCVGCPIGRFHTIQEACQAHEISEAVVMRDLLEAIADAGAV